VRRTYKILGGNELPPPLILLNSLPILVKVIVTAPSRIPSLMARFLEKPQFHPNGHFAGRAQLTLGLLCKIKKKTCACDKPFDRGKADPLPIWTSPMLAQLEAALAELGQQ
jgi:hypothetical protein